jgi:tetratricopeptide (TPR) repeat protein
MSIEAFLTALPTAANSPLAFVAYLALVVAWFAIAFRTKRLNLILKQIDKFPEAQRRGVLRDEFGLTLKEGLSAKDFLRGQRQKLVFVAFCAALLVVVVVASLATVRGIEMEKNAALQKSMQLALDATRLGITKATQLRLRESIGALQSAINAHPTAAGWMNLGYVYEEISDLDGAINAYRQALRFDSRNPYAHNALGFIFKDKAEYSKAEEHLLEAGKLISEDHGVHGELRFMIYGNLGNVYHEQAKLPKFKDSADQLRARALSTMLSVKELVEFVSRESSVAMWLGNIGNVYLEQGDLHSAEDYFTKSIAIKRRLAVSRTLANSLNNLAELRIKQGNDAGAEPLLREALSMFEEIENTYGQGVVYLHLGDIEQRAGRADISGSYHRKSFQLLSGTGSRDSYYIDAEKRVKGGRS